MDNTERKPGAAEPQAAQTADSDLQDKTRRQALFKMGGLAAAVAPAMLVLTTGKSKALPDCDNPAWNVGLNRSGHSGC